MVLSDAAEGFSPIPAVSTTSAARGLILHRALTQSLVVPLMSVTIAFCLPARAFSSVLLPVFGGPAKTIVQPWIISFAVRVATSMCSVSFLIFLRDIAFIFCNHLCAVLLRPALIWFAIILAPSIVLAVGWASFASRAIVLVNFPAVSILVSNCSAAISVAPCCARSFIISETMSGLPWQFMAKLCGPSQPIVTWSIISLPLLIVPR
ncbi:hypothetical protein ES703_114764 [subsurface metagenome]